MRPDIFLATIGRGSNGSNALEITEDRAGLASVNQDCLINSVNNVSQYGPSWHYYPSSIREDIAYTPVPTSGLGDLTFTRASDATYTDSTGVVRRSPFNLFTWSEMFSDFAWTKFNSLITANVTAAPNGTLTADKLALAVGIDPLSANSTGLFQTQTITSGVYNYSIYLKASERNIARWRDGGFSGNYLVVNLTNGTFTNGEPSRFVNPQVVFAGNGWWRVSFTTGTITNSNAYPLRFGDTGQTGDGVSGAFVWGAQLVEGTSALDYFPTTNRQDVPRIDFRNADGTLSSCGRLLLEPQRTNLVPNGLLYNASTGVAYNTTVSGSPMAGVNCARITKNEAAGTLRYANQNCSTSVLAGSTGYVLSAFFKYDGVDFTTSMEYNNATQFGGVSWNQVINIASTGITLGTSTSCTSTIENWGSGWYRVNVRITTGAAPSSSAVTYLMRLSSTLSTGQGFLHALPQLEAGAYPTTYIPTTTAAVTRIADAASKTGVSSLIGQTEGTLFSEVNWGVKPENGSPIISILTLNNNVTNAQNAIILGIERASGGTNRVYCLVQVSNVAQAALFGSTITSGNYKIALAYKQNDFVLYVNGVQISSDTSGNVPTTSQILLGQKFNGESFVMSDGIAQAALIKTRLTNAQLAQLTTL
jgi:hypothetical protein